MPGEKKAWAKKARRRHSVAPAKFTHHEGDKLPGRSTSFAEEIAEEVAEETVEDSAEEAVEETEEEVDEEIGEDPAEDSEETVEDLAEGPVEDSVEEIVEEVEEETEEEVSEEIADEFVDEETAEEAVEEAEDSAEDLGEYVDELSRELDALDEQKDDKLPGRSSSFERPKQTPQEKPTKRMNPTPAPTPAPAPEPVERPKPTKREKLKPAPESTSKPTPTPAAAARQKPTKRKKPAPRYRYIKSPSLEQAFRNLLRLDAGAAWRATRIPLVAFFLCFALLALAIADQAPAIDSFNATINALVHGARGMLDGFFVTITTLGDLLPMTALCLIVCAILAIARKWDSLAFFATNVLLAVVCVQALKFIFAVPRPGAETLVPIPGSFSFPSAHSFCSLIVFGMIGLLIFRAMNRKGVPYNAAIVPGIILVVFAILIGISRIYVGVHWPSDVLGGWLLAGMWLPFASALYTVGARKR